MLDIYADPEPADPDAPVMEQEELIAYLRSSANPSLEPLAAVLEQTEAIGDPALPTHEQAAVLRWLGDAFAEWEKRFPLEEPLATQIRRLKPMLAIRAISDPDFLVPGKHPLHQLLDHLQFAAVGWQPRLGRVGKALEQQFTEAVNFALADFETGDGALAEMCTQLAATTERDQARANRMTQRMIETELGRIRTAEAKQEAATTINAALRQFRAPPTIARFLKGPWYESAQLVLLKFGKESEQWQQMCATTQTLLDSLQDAETEEPARRQHIFEVVTQLPKDLKRWLLSLQHDNESINDAMALVEFAHLRILRKQPLELEHAQPIAVTEASASEAAQGDLEAVREGHWFRIALNDGETVRARLALKMRREKKLLFSNQAGIKELLQSFAEFDRLLKGGKVVVLDTGASFSRSLARLAGIKSCEDMEVLTGISAEKTRREEEDRNRLEQEQALRDAEEAERLLREQQEVRHMLQQNPDESGYLSQPQPKPAPGSVDVAKLPTGTADLAGVSLPMGTWLGFHDGDKPLLAKLAVHDREQNNYIFVNRSGIKMRQLNKQELSHLIENGLVDIMETRSNFRDEISRLKEDPEETPGDES